MNVLAIGKVKQGTETAMFRLGSVLHSSQYVNSLFNKAFFLLRNDYYI